MPISDKKEAIYIYWKDHWVLEDGSFQCSICGKNFDEHKRFLMKTKGKKKKVRHKGIKYKIKPHVPICPGCFVEKEKKRLFWFIVNQ